MTTEKAKMLAGEDYDPMDPKLVAERQAARQLTSLFNATQVHEGDRRREILTALFGSGGETAFVEPPFYCDYGQQIHVGEEFYANFGCVFLDVCEIRFGSECMLGPGVHVYTATHSLDAVERTSGTEFGAPVEVGDRAWIGGQAVLNPGVTIGDDVVVAAGSVVIDDVPDNVVVGGNPAEVIRELD
ncbi:MAG: sugar O-acetyltransferase [Halapricum sp.]